MYPIRPDPVNTAAKQCRPNITDRTDCQRIALEIASRNAGGDFQTFLAVADCTATTLSRQVERAVWNTEAARLGGASV